MFKDEKTHNTIHVDLDTPIALERDGISVFVSRSLDVLRDTHEYSVLLSRIPNNAINDADCSWWSSADALSLTEDIAKAFISYLPKGYRFGTKRVPNGGQAYGFWSIE